MTTTRQRAVFLLGIVALLVAGIWLLPKWIESSNAAWQHDAETSTVKSFREQQQEYQSLVAIWRKAYPMVNLCGLPSPGVGLVTFRQFQLVGDGSYVVSADGGVRPEPTLQDVANAMDIPSGIVESLISGLRSLHRSVMSQQDATLRIPAQQGNTYGVLFVPPSCPQASQYEIGGHAHGPSSFSELTSLGNGWFYYVEQR